MESRKRRDNSRDKLVRSSIGSEYPAFNRRVVSSSLTGPTVVNKIGRSLNGKAPVWRYEFDSHEANDWMNSSMAEQCPVKAKAESSNLSSSAISSPLSGEDKGEVSAPTMVSWACL